MPMRCIALLIAAAAGSGIAAQPTPLLTLDIAAIDQRNELISNLRAEELRVFDAGRRQQIAYFLRGEQIQTPADTLTQRAYSNKRSPTLPQALVVVLDQFQAKIEL